VVGLKEAPDAMKVGIVYSNLLDTREFEGSKNSEAARKEKSDEIKALLPIRCPRTSESDIERILNAVSLQNN